jgi:hypothetical protein
MPFSISGGDRFFCRRTLFAAKDAAVKPPEMAN